jgi:hypothetical protein
MEILAWIEGEGRMTTKPPKVKFRSDDPLQDYYSDGENLYSVARLLDDTKDLPVFNVPLAALNLTG